MAQKHPIRKMLMLLWLSLVLLGCTDLGSPESTGEFAIYTLADSTITASTALTYPLENLSLKPTPLLAAADLKSYRWATHSFEIRSEAGTKWIAFQQRGAKVWGVPFVVTVGSQRIYVGTFWWAHSSLVPPRCAVILMVSYPYSIGLQDGATDYRSDRRIRDALKRTGILEE